MTGVTCKVVFSLELFLPLGSQPSSMAGCNLKK